MKRLPGTQMARHIDRQFAVIRRTNLSAGQMRMRANQQGNRGARHMKMSKSAGGSAYRGNGGSPIGLSYGECS
jgi:hypothetical protein